MISPLLVAFENNCQASREKSLDLSATVLECHRQLGRTPDPIFARVNRKIIEGLEADAVHGEHRYHNRHHVRDVLAAIVLLLGQIKTEVAANANLAERMITAALGHDLHHDGRGSFAEPDVEHRSAAAVSAIGQDSGLAMADLDFIEGLILNTYPPYQVKLRQGLCGEKDLEGENLFKLMFGEADVLASLTPSFGKVLSVALAAEWRKAGIKYASMPDEPGGRAYFLECYRQVTPAARQMGVDIMVSEQLRQLKRNAS